MNNKLILGTVQFGLNYGINNVTGKLSANDIFHILDYAFDNGIDSLDTAEVYGDANETIGSYHNNRQHRFKINNKFRYQPGINLPDIIKSSLLNLNINQFEVLSFHAFSDYSNYPEVIHELKEFKSRGLIKKIGISIYTNDEFAKVIGDKLIDVIQLPYNVLDNENLRGSLIKKAKENFKEIHVRSVFLQGLIFADEDSLKQNLSPIKYYIGRIKDLCKNQSIDLQSLALSYVAFNESIDKILIGVDNQDQLDINLRSFKNNKSAFDFINQNILVIETELLNPVNWK